MELARVAARADHEVCLSLLGRALGHAATVRGGPALIGQATPQALLDRWGAAGARIFVGEYAGAVVGLLGLSLSDPVAGRRHALIECAYVEDGARGVGVGSALTDIAVAWAAEQGCTDVDALALPGDRATKQRLEAAGFSARLLVLSRRSG